MTDYNDLIIKIENDDKTVIDYKVLFKTLIGSEEICVFYRQVPLSFVSARLKFDQQNKQYELYVIKSDEVELLKKVNHRLNLFFIDNKLMLERLKQEEEFLTKMQQEYKKEAE